MIARVFLLACLIGIASAFPETFTPKNPASKSAILGQYQFHTEIDVMNLLPGGHWQSDDFNTMDCTTTDPTTMCRTTPSFGSDIWLEADGTTAYVLSDRGPNTDCRDTASSDKDPAPAMYPAPSFTPGIYKIKLPENPSTPISIEAAMPLHGAKFITGRGNRALDGQPVLWHKAVGVAINDSCPQAPPLDYDVSGLDTEAIVKLPNGIFVLSEEYAPSILFVNAEGKILLRLIPHVAEDPTLYRDINSVSASYPVEAVLPAFLALRRSNRGFENLAVSRNGKTLWATLQSPLDKSKSTLLRTIRLTIKSFDPITVTYDGMYLHRMEDKNLKASASFFLSGKKILNLERFDGKGSKPAWVKLFILDFANATNLKGYTINGQPADGYNKLLDTATALPSNIVLATKTKVWDSMELDDAQKGLFSIKLEGVTAISRTSVLMTEDNDFGLNGTRACRIFVAHLTQKLPPYGPAPYSDVAAQNRQADEDDAFAEGFGGALTVTVDDTATEVPLAISSVLQASSSESSEGSQTLAVAGMAACACACFAALVVIVVVGIKRRNTRAACAVRDEETGSVQTEQWMYGLRYRENWWNSSKRVWERRG